MKIESNGKSYEFTFQHGTTDVNYAPNKRNRAEYTTFFLNYQGKNLHASVKKHFKDKSNKVRARTIALLKAIKDLPENDRRFILETIPIRFDTSIPILHFSS